MARGKHPNSRRNLRRPIQKGEVLNPLGINRKRPLTDRLFRDGETLLIDSPEGRKILKRHHLPKTATWADAAARRTLKEAANGNIRAVKEYGDRTEGKPAQQVIFAGVERKEVTVRILYDRISPRLSSSD